MRFPIRIRIFDPYAVLSELDHYQIENMLWLKLAPFELQLKSVQLEVTKVNPNRYGQKHVVEIRVLMQSGTQLECCSMRVSKGAALMASLDEVQPLVRRRVQVEASWLYRVFGKPIDSARSALGRGMHRPPLSRRSCTGSAT